MARRPGLGRGLDALIPGGNQPVQQSSTTGGAIQIDIEAIRPNPQQPRSTLIQEDLEDLAASIREHGIIQPLVVSKNDDGEIYTLIAGERRWRAAQLVGLETVPVIIRTVTEQEQLELALIENIQREDLNPLERAIAYQNLLNEFSLTHDEIATRVGKSRTSITNTVRLLNLSERVKKALTEKQISEGHARTLLGLPQSRSQDAALDTIIKLDLNVRQTEVLINKLSGKKAQVNLPRGKPAEIIDLEDRLRTYFKTKVNVSPNKKGGTINIFYFSDEELNAILDLIF
ncbi:MAG: ParB/RepB/Spo0J family partition protein [Anaerolineaceae bacterium]|nr:ParB/RepB/Spo0J family partition protein [Anaerolineaceae bacterium]